MGPKMEPTPNPPVLIAETLDWSFVFSFRVRGRPRFFSLSSCSVRIMAGVELLLMRAPPTPASSTPKQRVQRSSGCSAYTATSRKGAGPVRNMLTTNTRQPMYCIRPYFFPFASSFTKLRPTEVIEYMNVSKENINPISITST